MSDLICRDLCMTFSDAQSGAKVEALKNINFDLKQGEILTVLGPSGCGKTTLLNMIAGFLNPTSGDLTLGGKTIEGPGAERGMVFQQGALFEWLTVARNVDFGLRMRGADPADSAAKVEGWLDTVGLQGFGSTPTYQLSGGMQQRVALARCLVNDPSLILMDEPLGALDKQLREHMQYEIKHIHENLGVTVVYVTHDQSEALTMSNRIAVFDDGIIQQLADPVTLYEKPENAFVAQFIGENNTLAGTVTSLSGGVASVTLDSGDAVKALAINTDGKGSATQLSVRPERCVVTPKKKAGLSSLKGRIEELIYLGDHIRCRMTVAGNDEFIVKVPNTADQLGLQIGAESYVGWQTDDCRALDVKDA